MPATPGLNLFLERIRQALVAAGISPNEATVTQAAQAWNYWSAENQSFDWFVNLLKHLATTPQWQQAVNPYAQPGGQTPAPQYQGWALPVVPGLQQQNWEVEQNAYVRLTELQYQTQLDIANINTAADRYIAELNAALQRELAAGNITAQQAMLAQELAQSESQFARDLALRQLIADRSYEIAQAELQLRERELKAQLAANPADWLTYQAFLRGGTLPGAPASGEATTAASAEDIKAAAESLTTGTGALYNPNLAGVGVAGAEVPSPADVSRWQMYAMSPTEQQMFAGFLRGGIEIDGRRVAINPEDWFQQAQRGWIPSLDAASFMPQYA